MTLSSYNSLLILIFMPVIKLQLIDINTNTPNRSEPDRLIVKLSRVAIITALTNDRQIKVLNSTTAYSTEKIRISSDFFTVKSNPLLTMLDLCEAGNRSHAKVIIASRAPEDDDLVLAAISYVSDFYHIPLLTISSRENIFSDKRLYNFMLRLVPPYLYEADAWFSIIRQLKYTQIVLIYSQDEESRMVTSRFQMLTDDSEIQIERMEEYSIDTNFTALITNLTADDRLLPHVFIIHARVEDIDDLLSVIIHSQQLGNFVWILNERALISTSTALFDGLLGVRLHRSFNEENLLLDATQLIVNTFTELLDHPSTFSTENTSILDCASTEPWLHGKDVYRAFLNSKVKRGITGDIQFNEAGDRIESLYEVINIRNGKPTVVGTYLSNTSNCYTSNICRGIVDSTKLNLLEERIIWPNGLNRKPDGIRTRRNVTVVTILEKPFIFTRPGNDCDPSFEIFCPRTPTNSSIEEHEEYCCYGYCIDLLQELSKNLSFVYTLHLVGDGKYGSFEKEGEDQQKRWDGMIGELINYQADMIVAPLTMSPERADDIEFTKPYKYQGITVLVRKNQNQSNLASFLQPFKGQLWIMVLLSVHLIAVGLCVMDRFSPFGRFRFTARENAELKTKSETETNDEEDSLNLSRALWFTWGILLNSGIGEGSPRSLSARVLGMVWAGFAMIMVASYTANLAAFLVLDRPEASISGINDARLRNPQDGFTFATVKGSSVDMYFKRQVELSTMHRTMESINYLTAEEAISDLRNEKLNAFIWDSPRLEYEAALDCDLITAGELFGRSSYGIALRKKDAWINPLSHAILSFHEKGYMELLDNKWIFSKHEHQCSDRSSSPATLKLDNMLGVFLLVAGGALVGLVLLVIEIIFKRQKIRLERESKKEIISRTAAVRWKRRTEECKEQHLAVFDGAQNRNRQDEHL